MLFIEGGNIMTMSKKDFRDLAKAVRNGMKMEEALEIINNEPANPDKAAFFLELDNPRTTLSIYKQTKVQLKAMKKKDETYDDALNRLIESYKPED